MYVRLGFAIAAHLDPEVLIVDEVLAVGDIAFQKKCLGRMGEVAKSGRTVLFVSHNMTAVSSLCTKAIHLSRGQIDADGPVDQVVSRYLQLSENAASTADTLLTRTDRTGTGESQFSMASVGGTNGEAIRSGQPVRFRLTVAHRNKLSARNVVVNLTIKDWTGNAVFSCVNVHQGFEIRKLDDGAQITCDLPRLPLAPGRYSVYISLMAAGIVCDCLDHAIGFDVHPYDIYGTGRLPDCRKHGSVIVDADWTIPEPQPSESSDG